MRIRVAPERTGRSWGFVSWLPVVVDFGVVRFNRWWWHNLHCRFPLVYRLHYGEWPLYREWKRSPVSPKEGTDG